MMEDTDTNALAAEAEALKRFMDEDMATPRLTKDGRKTARQEQADRALRIAMENAGKRIGVSLVKPGDLHED